jgi:hypothetical protein
MDIDAHNITAIAHGISDFGLLMIAAGVFVLLSAALWIGIFSWFKTMIDNLIEQNKQTMVDLLAETRTQNEKLTDISEGLIPETRLRIKTISNAFFDLSVEKVCQLIDRVRTENHIEDKIATAEKIRTLLRIQHDDRNTRFDCFVFRGRKLSEYTSSEWTEQVAEVVEREIYNETGPNAARSRTNVKAIFDNIKLDFYHRMNG